MWARYGLAFLATGLTTLFRMLLAPALLEGSPFVLFILSGAVVAWWGGIGPGLLAFALGWVAGGALFAPEYFQAPFADAAATWRTILFFFVGAVISTMAEALHRALRRARDREQIAYAEAFARAVANARLDLLVSTATELLKSSDPKAIVKDLCGRLMDLLECEVFFHHTAAAPDGHLRLNAFAGLSPEAQRAMETLNPADGHIGTLLASAASFRAGTESPTAAQAQIIERLGIRACVCHPLMAGGKLLGALGFGTRTRNEFTKDEVELMRSMTDHVALAQQRHMVEEARRESEERYRAFVSTSHEAIWRIEFDEPIDTSLPMDEQVRVYFERAYYAEANDALARLYGFDKAEEVRGTRVISVEPPDKQETLDSIRQFIAAGYRRTNEVSYEVDRHGNPRNFLNNYVGIVEHGKLVRLWGSSLDITEHHRAEAALRESEATLKAFHENSPANMGLVELGETEVFHLYDNPTSCRTLGLQPGETAGKWCSQLGLPREVSEVWLARLRECVATGKPVTFDMAHDFPGRPRLWLSTTVAPLPKGTSERPRCCYVSLDITARRLFEEQLAAAKENAEAANRAKDEFLAALSHELRTPLSPVLLTASEMREDETLEPAHREDWDMVYRNVSLQARLVDDLLDLTRIARGKLALNLRRLDAHKLVQQALVTVRGDLQQKLQRLSVELHADRCELLADETRLQQVFWNILKNAVKFTPDRGAIVIRSANVEGQSMLRISVLDTGIGLSPEEANSIFEAFVQGEHAHGAKAHRFGGMGMGLAISQRIVELHKGRIWAESAGRDQGTIFHVELPVENGEPH